MNKSKQPGLFNFVESFRLCAKILMGLKFFFSFGLVVCILWSVLKIQSSKGHESRVVKDSDVDTCQSMSLANSQRPIVA